MMRTRQTLLILMLAFVLGVFAARLPSSVAMLARPGGSADPYTVMGTITDVFDIIDRQYVEPPNETALLNGAINGMLEALDDPYTQYIPPADRAAFQKEMMGQFVGIGAEVTISGGYLTIVTPLDDSPAYNAGIRPGDRIVEIEGQSTLNVSIDDCIAKLTGKPGEPVHVVVERGGPGGQRIPKTIIRQQIVVRAVKGVRREPVANGQGSPDHSPRWQYLIDPAERIAYVRLTQFTPTAGQELADALGSVDAGRPANEGGLRGLILDLRNNPGGVLDAAVQVADLFLREGAIVSVKGRAGPEEVHRAKAEGTLPEFPMVVLVNGASASASEIVAGALSDHGRAVIVGTRTFGKGLVQAVQALRRTDGGQIKYTSQRYYLPSGRLIQRTDASDTWGVDPTPGFYVPMTEQEQIARILQRREHDLLPARPDGEPDAAPAAPAAPEEPQRWDDPAWIEQTMKDKQLAGALTALRSRLATGQWTPLTTEARQPERVKLAELHQLELGRERILRELARVERRIGALEAVAAGDATAQRSPADLWPNDLNLTGGRIDVYDKDGAKVRTLTITGPNLERWLIDADVKPVDEPADAPAAADTPPKGD
jgi:carboxyl-terminal processing protease